MTRALLIATALLTCMCINATSVAAQATLDADDKELKAYTLTTTALKQFVATTRAMIAAAKSDPRYTEVAKLEAEIEKLEAKEEPTDADYERLEKLNAELETLESKLPRVNMADASLKSLSDIENAIKKEPLMANALRSSGMSARDYAKFTLAFFQAAMIHGMQKSGHLKEIPKDLQATVNMENVKFIEANQAEINALMAEFQAASKKQ
jgi:DNA repair exonuclease SbcCD ATPase subunit